MTASAGPLTLFKGDRAIQGDDDNIGAPHTEGDGGAAVSYTHLDVYKRQELIRQGVPQSERLLRLNASAKQMMQSLVGDHRIDEFRTYGELPNKESK